MWDGKMANVVSRERQVFTECDSANDGVRQAESLPFALPFQPKFSSSPGRLTGDLDIFQALDKLGSGLGFLRPHARVNFRNVDGAAAQFMALSKQRPEHIATAPSMAQGVNDHRSVQ